ncbi:NUDIX hydrolase [Hyphomonas sp.]|uniref:NUDIX hydrolase n=1 Tax=Alphaproteobacteria TaxID=28211 RepID=UPI003265AD79
MTNRLYTGVNRSTSDTERLQFGVLPWRFGRDGEIRILLITSRTRGRWIVPKGWLVKGRSPAQSAAQEAFEEAGIIGQIHSRPLGEYRYTKVGGDRSGERCRVTLFGFRVQGTLINWPEQHERQRRWLSLGDAARTIDEPDLARLVLALQPDIEAFTEPDRVGC